MNRRTTLTLRTMALLCLAVALQAGIAVAQLKQKVSFKVPAENAKYSQPFNINVGDAPDDIVRVYEIRASFR